MIISEPAPSPDEGLDLSDGISSIGSPFSEISSGSLDRFVKPNHQTFDLCDGCVKIIKYRHICGKALPSNDNNSQASFPPVLSQMSSRASSPSIEIPERANLCLIEMRNDVTLKQKTKSTKNEESIDPSHDFSSDPAQPVIDVSSKLPDLSESVLGILPSLINVPNDFSFGETENNPAPKCNAKLSVSPEKPDDINYSEYSIRSTPMDMPSINCEWDRYIESKLMNSSFSDTDDFNFENLDDPLTSDKKLDNSPSKNVVSSHSDNDRLTPNNGQTSKSLSDLSSLKNDNTNVQNVTVSDSESSADVAKGSSISGSSLFNRIDIALECDNLSKLEDAFHEPPENSKQLKTVMDFVNDSLSSDKPVRSSAGSMSIFDEAPSELNIHENILNEPSIKPKRRISRLTKGKDDVISTGEDDSSEVTVENVQSDPPADVVVKSPSSEGSKQISAIESHFETDLNQLVSYCKVGSQHKNSDISGPVKKRSPTKINGLVKSPVAFDRKKSLQTEVAPNVPSPESIDKIFEEMISPTDFISPLKYESRSSYSSDEGNFESNIKISNEDIKSPENCNIRTCSIEVKSERLVKSESLSDSEMSINDLKIKVDNTDERPDRFSYAPVESFSKKKKRKKSKKHKMSEFDHSTNLLKRENSECNLIDMKEDTILNSESQVASKEKNFDLTILEEMCRLPMLLSPLRDDADASKEKVPNGCRQETCYPEICIGMRLVDYSDSSDSSESNFNGSSDTDIIKRDKKRKLHGKPPSKPSEKIAIVCPEKKEQTPEISVKKLKLSDSFFPFKKPRPKTIGDSLTNPLGRIKKIKFVKPSPCDLSPEDKSSEDELKMSAPSTSCEYLDKGIQFLCFHSFL